MGWTGSRFFFLWRWRPYSLFAYPNEGKHIWLAAHDCRMHIRGDLEMAVRNADWKISGNKPALHHCLSKLWVLNCSLTWSTRPAPAITAGQTAGQRRRLYSAVPGRVFVATRSHSAQGEREISFNKGDRVKGEYSYMFCVMILWWCVLYAVLCLPCNYKVWWWVHLVLTWRDCIEIVMLCSFKLPPEVCGSAFVLLTTCCVSPSVKSKKKY